MEEDEGADTGVTEADMNEPISPEDGRRALHVAAAEGDVEEVKKLLGLGAMADMLDYAGNTALHYAAREGHVDIVKLLLGNISSLDIPNDKNSTPLCLAIEANQKEVVKMLLNKGANVNINVKWCSILLTAMEERDENLVQALLESQVSVSLIEATQSGRVDLTKYAIETLQSRPSDTQMNEAFHSVVSAGKSELVELFLTYNVDLDKVDNKQNTPLLNTLLNEHYEVADKLLENGANIDAFDGLALRKTAEIGNVNIVKFLLDRNVNLNLRNSKGMTPLHVAVTNNHYEIVKLLVQKEADVNTVNDHSESPLYTAIKINIKNNMQSSMCNNIHESTSYSVPIKAVEAKQADIVYLLIERNANVNFENSGGRTLLDIAIRNGSIPLANTLLEAGARFDYEESTESSGNLLLSLAVQLGDVDLCRRLLDKGVSVNSTDGKGNTLLLQAMGCLNHTQNDESKYELIKMFLSYGANVLSTNKKGFQAINLAAKFPNQHLVELLIENGALDDISSNLHLIELLNDAFRGNHKGLIDKILNCDDLEFDKLKSAYGDTVLHLAASYGKVDVIRTLLSKGVYVNVTDNYGNSPLHKACRSKKLEAVELLLENGASMNMLDNSGQSPVHIVIIYNDISFFRPFINHDSFVDQPHPTLGRTMCHVLAKKNDVEFMKLYLAKENEDNVNIPDYEGNSAFHITINRRHVEMSRLISKHVTEPDKRNKNDLTPLMLTVCCNLELYRVDGDQDKQSFSAEHWETINQSIELAKLILELGGKIDTQNDYGNTALHISVLENNVQMTKFLLESGANMNIKNKDGFTALHFAAQVGNFSLLKILLENITVSNHVNHEDLKDCLHNSGKNQPEKEVIKQDLINTATNSGKTPLYLAVENFPNQYFRSNIEKNVQLLIDSGADVNIKDAEGVTPLMVATTSSSYGENCRLVAEKLFSCGAVIDFSDSTNTCTLLMNAIRKSYKFLIEHIIKNIEDIDMQDKNGNTALHTIFSGFYGEGKYELVVSLLDRGADINVANEEGDTAVHIAARNPSGLGCIETFLEKGANINLPNRKGETVLHVLAASYKKVEFFGKMWSLTMRRANVDALNNENQTPLHRALASISCRQKEDDIEFIRLLIEHKASLSAVDGAGNTPLYIAMAVFYNCCLSDKKNDCCNCVNILKLLLNKGAQVGTGKDEQVEQIIRVAFQSNRQDVVKSLVESGIDLKCKNIILKLAGEKKWYDIIENLLSQGADCNKSFEFSYGTFLLFSLRSGDDKLIDMVLEKASYLDLRNSVVERELLSAARNYSKLLTKKGSSDDLDKYFLTQSLKRKQFGKALMLLDKRVKLDVKDDQGNSPLQLAVQSGSLVMVNILLGKGVDVHSVDDDGQTVLHRVCSNNRVDIARVLIAKNASVHAQDKRGRTPLHMVSYCCPDAWEMASLLISNGASVDKTDFTGDTPLHKSGSSAQVTKLLIEKGASVHARNDRGETPLHLVRSVEEAKVTKLLIEKGASVHARNDRGETPLHLVRSIEAARVLIEHGASTNARDEIGRSPLHAGVSLGLELIKLLLDNNALVDVKDVFGETPLLKVVGSYVPNEGTEIDKIVKLLVEKGADCSVEIEYESLLLRAIENGNVELQYLLDNGAKVDCQQSLINVISKLRFDSAYKTQLFVLCKHILKLNLAGLPVQNALEAIQCILPNIEEEINSKFFVTCLMELNKIKSTEVYEGFTLNKIFSNYHKPKPKFLLDEDTVGRLDTLLQARSLLEHFPMYGYILRNLYKEMKNS